MRRTQTNLPKRAYFLPALIIILNLGLVKAQTVCTIENREKLEATLVKLDQIDASQKSINELTIEIGTWFLNTPYVEKTLELPGEEKLVINLNGLDCTTFAETIVALSRLSKKGNLTFGDFENELEKIRYRDGRQEDYPSRLHYFSDWIYENQQKGILEDITKSIGGTVYENKPSFMSSNPKFYAQLSNPEFVSQLQLAEKEIASRSYFYIPKEEISRLESGLQSGDLIAITTTMKNLDIVHVGFAIQKEGRIHLLHASSTSKKVEISTKPLSEYLLANKSQSGIMVCRILDPSKTKDLTMDSISDYNMFY